MRIAALAIAVSSAAFAQSTYGTIYGTVTDPSSAVVRGAKVEAIDEHTGVTLSLETDANGQYRFVNLDPGVYTLAAIASGFSRTERKSVSLLARDELAIPFQLALASAAGTTIEVTATPAVSEALTLSYSKSFEEINDLALNFRATSNPSPIGVATLSPGAQTDSSGNITIGGQLPTATSYSLDGVSTVSYTHLDSPVPRSVLHPGTGFQFPGPAHIAVASSNSR